MLGGPNKETSHNRSEDAERGLGQGRGRHRRVWVRCFFQSHNGNGAGTDTTVATQSQRAGRESVLKTASSRYCETLLEGKT